MTIMGCLDFSTDAVEDARCLEWVLGCEVLHFSTDALSFCSSQCTGILNSIPNAPANRAAAPLREIMDKDSRFSGNDAYFQGSCEHIF